MDPPERIEEQEEMELEGRMIAQAAGSANGREGLDAFLSKRRPEFK